MLALLLAATMTPLSAAISQSDISLRSGVWPVMVRMDYNPVLEIKIKNPNGAKLDSLKFDFTKTTNLGDIEEANVFIGGNETSAGTLFGKAKPTKNNPIVTVKASKPVALGDGAEVSLWLSVRMKKNANITGTLECVGSQILFSSEKKPFSINSVPVKQRIGYAVAKAGDLGSKNYRIPAIARTANGTLVATFDIRYNHGGDLPANIDVGVSRSRDGGKTWTEVESVLKSDGLGGGKGIGDPAILFDDKTGTLWISALLSPKSGHPIWASVSGSDSPKNCGQMILISSKNEGKSWSKPVNITSDIKRLKDADTRDWGCVFQGPGSGICTKNGTLIFPAQIWGNQGKGAKGVLVYSKDNGKTWTSSKEMPWGGSESTCVQLADKSIMLNVRQGSPSERIVATTKNLGETWEKFAGEKLRQPGNLCQAALLTANGKELYFSNPNSGRRDNMTLKFSKDGGKTWNDGLLYDERKCAGYSTLAFADLKNERVGVLYEGSPDAQVLFFLSIPAKEIKRAK